MVRPLARWTLGKVNYGGEECLRHSVRRFRTLYPEFDLVVCYNHLSAGQYDRLIKLDVPMCDQRESDLGYPLESVDSPPGVKWAMPGWGWKLCPPRLRPGAHELWIDNDIIVRRRLPSLDLWLNSGRTLVSTALYRSYGIYEEFIPDETPYCAGFFGVPADWDFRGRLRHHLERLGGKPLGYYDEQGAVVATILERDPVVVPPGELTVAKNIRRPLSPGLHFIGLNRTAPHLAWERYKCCVLT